MFSFPSLHQDSLYLRHDISCEFLNCKCSLLTPPFMGSHEDKLVLKEAAKFMHKMVIGFHLNQTLILIVFLPKPHSYPEEVRLWMVAFHICRSKEYRRLLRLHLCFLVKGHYNLMPDQVDQAVYWGKLMSLCQRD